MGSLGPSNSLWDREFDTILIDLDDTLYHKPAIPAQVRQNIEGAQVVASRLAGCLEEPTQLCLLVVNALQKHGLGIALAASKM